MIRLLSFVLLLAAAPPPSGMLVAAKKDPTPPAPAKAGTHFMIRLKPIDADSQATEEQKTRIVMHFEYLKALQSDGKLVLAGMTPDDGWMEILVLAADASEAEGMMNADPAVSGKVYQGEVHPFQVVLSGRNP